MPKNFAPAACVSEAPPKFPVKDHLVQEYHLGSEWEMEGCSCLQMSDTSVWFVVPYANQRKSSSLSLLVSKVVRSIIQIRALHRVCTVWS